MPYVRIWCKFWTPTAFRSARIGHRWWLDWLECAAQLHVCALWLWLGSGGYIWYRWALLAHPFWHSVSDEVLTRGLWDALTECLLIYRWIRIHNTSHWHRIIPGTCYRRRGECCWSRQLLSTNHVPGDGLFDQCRRGCRPMDVHQWIVSIQVSHNHSHSEST